MRMQSESRGAQSESAPAAKVGVSTKEAYDPAARAVEEDVVAMEIETKFLRFRQPPTLGECIDGWRVCWLGGWDRGRVFFVVMVERRPPQRARHAAPIGGVVREPSY